MKANMQLPLLTLEQLVEAHAPTAGMYVRAHGSHLMLGRREIYEPGAEPEDDDRVRFTRLNASTFGLSVKRHTGRWERTPFSGKLKDVFETMLTFAQHLLAPTPGCTKTFGA